MQEETETGFKTHEIKITIFNWMTMDKTGRQAGRDRDKRIRIR